MPEIMTGITPATFAYFADLAADNSKAFWTRTAEHRQRHVAEPFEALIGAIETETGTDFKRFRMHRDTRFSPDKSPYKTMMGAVDRETGLRYLHFDAEGMLVASGHYVMDKPTLAAFRAALAGPAGEAFAAIVEELRARGIEVGPGGAAPLKTAPRGIDTDHPRIEYLRWKGAICMRRFPVDDVTTKTALRKALSFWETTAGLRDWLRTEITT